MKHVFLSVILLACTASVFAQSAPKKQPNIVVIYVDDLGYGDLSCYGATRVHTPNIDQLAKNGLQFTDAHCSAATCTPSRYSLLTGSYAFRNNAAILPGDAPLLIRPGTSTLPGMLQKAGYKTGIVGKWHLGLGNGTVNWNGEISPGPLEVGFDYSFIVPATLDRVPCVFVENHKVVNLDQKDPIEVSYEHKIGNEPTGLEHPELLKMKADSQHSNTIINGISRIGWMKGGKSAWWVDEEIPNVLLQKAKAFFQENRDKPFFLYLSYTDIHVPRAPNPMFEGKTEMGRRGDDIVQMDWMTGEVLQSLRKLGLMDNTLIIFTSDNGPVLNDGYEDGSETLVGSHKPAGPFKGGKYSAFEGGTRVPTIVFWPGVVKPGQSAALINQVDFYSSLAQLAGHKLAADEAPDSYNLLLALLGQSADGRKLMLEEAFTLALRDGNWKYIAPQAKPTPDWLRNKDIATGLSPEAQLYNLQNNKCETANLAKQHPDLLEKMRTVLKEMVAHPTRPGYHQ